MENNKTYRHHPVDPDSYTVVERGVADLYIPNEDTQPVIRAIGVSHTACKDEFRQNLRSHSWSVFSFFIILLRGRIRFQQRKSIREAKTADTHIPLSRVKTEKKRHANLPYDQSHPASILDNAAATRDSSPLLRFPPRPWPRRAINATPFRQ